MSDAEDASIGVTQQELGTPPDTSCQFFSSAGRDYWFCAPLRSWQTARTKCQAVNLDLVSIGSASENQFVSTHLLISSWIGANDISVEGQWRWAQSDTQFWQGAWNGTAVGGAYKSWSLLQPDNLLNQDCGTTSALGVWTDELCSTLRPYVCEGVVDLCPNDPNKVQAGQCGCDNPDTDSDNDGTADCNDGCVNDPGKTAPGACGCGKSDADTDNDGVTCDDLCPNDQTKTEPGDCGCADAPRPSGTSCNDGLCTANTQCTGTGSCGSTSQCTSPDGDCTFRMRAGRRYWFCNNDRLYSDALQRCQAAGMELATIESAGEDAFITQHAREHSFIGGSDQATEGTWVWLSTGAQFWQGTWNGSAVGGAYTNFALGEPSNLLSGNDCMVKSLLSGGQWKSHPCSFHDAFVCEREYEPALIDSDCDGIGDAQEVSAGLDPLNPADGKLDPDNDDIPNADELSFGGDPNNADTDGDGELDTTDLLNGRDLDGDGAVTEHDNCPDIANAQQLDADGDGEGDLCDATPVGAIEIDLGPALIARSQLNQSFGLMLANVTDEQRLAADQNGLLPTGDSFLIAESMWSGGVEVTELWNETLKRHAYAVSTSERATWEARGYVASGSIGFVTATVPAFGTAVSVRRFERNSGGVMQALAVSASGAAALLASGYTEVSALGYGLVDEGQLRKPRTTVRYRRESDGATLHSSLPVAELGFDGYASDGKQFQVLREKNGRTKPLYRLRNSAGREVLSTDVNEHSSLTGYSVEGVIGHVFGPGADTPFNLVDLVRLTGPGKPYEHTADATEIVALRAQGYTQQTVLGKVVRLPARLRADANCVGVDPLSRLDRSIPPDATEEQRNVAAMRFFASAWTTERALTGQAVGEQELLIAQLAQRMDPESKDQLLRRARDVNAIDPAERAERLGKLDELVPHEMGKPINYQTVNRAAGIAEGFNGGVSGGIPHLSFARLRTPQCGGVTYALDDPADASAAQRAVTATEDGTASESCPPEDEFCPPVVNAGRVKPTMLGVTKGAFVPTDSPAELWKANHVAVGFPLIGIDIGACSGACSASLGQRCWASRCRQYPIVENGSDPVFSGANLWDVVTPRLQLTRDLNDTVEPEMLARLTILGPGDGVPGDSAAARCEPKPLPVEKLDDDFSDPVVPPATVCTESPTDVRCPDVAEQVVEHIAALGEIAVSATNEFYRVQAVNFNGSYLRIGDEYPLSPSELEDNIRTIHICTPPACEPIADPVNAACALNALPACGAPGVGGVWNTPPRSLAACRALDPFVSQCPETPLYFKSDVNAVGPNGVSSFPLLVFIAEPDQEQFIQTRLASAVCYDETGWDRGGDDEIRIVFTATTATALPRTLDVDDLALRVGVMEFNANSNGSPHAVGRLMGNQRTTLSSAPEGAWITIVEDDSVGFTQILITTLAAGGAVASAWGGAVVLVVAAGVGGGTVGLVGALNVSLFDADDFIGQAGWKPSLSNVASTGALVHDGLMSTVPPLLETLPGDSRNLSWARPSEHASVDGVADKDNAGIVSCGGSTVCPTGQRCYENACVPLQWIDRTLPARFSEIGGIPGVVEQRRFTGSGTDYRLYITTSVSPEEATQ